MRQLTNYQSVYDNFKDVVAVLFKTHDSPLTSQKRAALSNWQVALPSLLKKIGKAQAAKIAFEAKSKDLEVLHRAKEVQKSRDGLNTKLGKFTKEEENLQHLLQILQAKIEKHRQLKAKVLTTITSLKPQLDRKSVV